MNEGVVYKLNESVLKIHFANKSGKSSENEISMLQAWDAVLEEQSLFEPMRPRNKIVVCTMKNRPVSGENWVPSIYDLDMMHPMDPAVPSKRKWDWGIVYYNLEG